METQKKSGSNLSPVIIFVILLIAIGGYFFFQQKKGPPLSPEMKAAKEAVLKDCAYDKEFCMYAANAAVAMSQGFSMTSESTYEGKKTVMVMKTDGKNNTESTTTIDGKEEGSFIMLDGSTYMKAAGEKEWIEYPPMKEDGKAEKQGLFDIESFKADMMDLSNEAKDSLSVKKIGTEKCGVYSCIIFEMNEKAMNTTTKVWVDTQEYLARKMETSSGGSKTVMTFEYGPITISKPSPVKTMPSFDSMMQESGVNINMEDIQNMMKDLPNEE